MGLFQPLMVIFTIILFGVYCRKKDILSEVQATGFEIFLFKVAFPCYFFTTTMQHDFFNILEETYIFSYFLVFLIVAFVTWIVFYKTKSLAQISIYILASGYVNAAIYALPVITFVLKDPKAGIIGNLLQVIIIQTIFVMILSFLKHRTTSLSRKLLTTLSSPMICMPTIGLIVNYFGINLPDTLITIINILGHGASGLALFTFGLSMGNVSFDRSLFEKKVCTIVLIKTVFHPLVAYGVGRYVFCLDIYWFAALLISSSAPTAFIVSIISNQFSVQENIIRKVVMLSSVISLISLLLMVFAMGEKSCF